jgi:hypothetical protein
MPSTGKIILEGFLHPTIPPIIGIPTYESISKLNLQLNTNAASVHSNLATGDGMLGLLTLTITPAVFNTLPAIPFIVSINPGAQQAIQPGTTAAQISDITHCHIKSIRIWKEYLSTDNFRQRHVLLHTSQPCHGLRQHNNLANPHTPIHKIW